MRDYIAEANKFMYDDDYVVESKFKLNGKEYGSKKAAEDDLKKKGVSGSKLSSTLGRGKFEKKDASSTIDDLEQKHYEVVDKVFVKHGGLSRSEIARHHSLYADKVANPDSMSDADKKHFEELDKRKKKHEELKSQGLWKSHPEIQKAWKQYQSKVKERNANDEKEQEEFRRKESLKVSKKMKPKFKSKPPK